MNKRNLRRCSTSLAPLTKYYTKVRRRPLVLARAHPLEQAPHLRLPPPRPRVDEPVPDLSRGEARLRRQRELLGARRRGLGPPRRRVPVRLQPRAQHRRLRRVVLPRGPRPNPTRRRSGGCGVYARRPIPRRRRAPSGGIATRQSGRESGGERVERRLERVRRVRSVS